MSDDEKIQITRNKKQIKPKSQEARTKEIKNLALGIWFLGI